MGIKMDILDENPFWTRFKENCSAICSFYNHNPSDEILDRFPEDVGAGYLDAPEKLIDEDLGKFIFFRYNILRLDWTKKCYLISYCFISISEGIHRKVGP